MNAKLAAMTLPLLLVSSLGISACGSKSQVVRPNPVHLDPPDKEWMEPVQPNLRQRLQQLSTESPLTATPPSGS